MRLRHGLLAALVCTTLVSCASPAPRGPSAAQAASDIDWEKAQPMTVRLTDFAFTPDRLSFEAGVPVRLTLINAGSGEHDFAAPRFFATVAFRQATAGSGPDGDISLKAGETAQIEFVPEQAGTYPLECTELLHAMFGMTGTIKVETRS